MSGRLQSYNRYLVDVSEADSGYPDHVILGVGVTSLPTIPSGVNSALVAISSTSVTGAVVALYRLDGGDPTATKGMPLYAGGEIHLFESEVAGFRILPVGASAQTIMVEFGKVS